MSEAADLWLALLRTQRQVGFWEIFIECQFFSESVDTNRGLPARSLSCDAWVCEGWPGCGLGESGHSFRWDHEWTPFDLLLESQETLSGLLMMGMLCCRLVTLWLESLWSYSSQTLSGAGFLFMWWWCSSWLSSWWLGCGVVGEPAYSLSSYADWGYRFVCGGPLVRWWLDSHWSSFGEPLSGAGSLFMQWFMVVVEWEGQERLFEGFLWWGVLCWIWWSSCHNVSRLSLIFLWWARRLCQVLVNFLCCGGRGVLGDGRAGCGGVVMVVSKLSLIFF